MQTGTPKPQGHTESRLPPLPAQPVKEGDGEEKARCWQGEGGGEYSIPSENTKIPQMQMQMGMANMGGGGPQGFDASAAFRMERDQLGITKRGQNLENAERDLLGDRYPRDVREELDFSKLDNMRSMKS